MEKKSSQSSKLSAKRKTTAPPPPVITTIPTIIQFIPYAALGIWHSVEYHPVRLISGVAGICEEGQESYWSVFLQHKIEGLQCIADLPTKQLAITLSSLIRISAVTFKSQMQP